MDKAPRKVFGVTLAAIVVGLMTVSPLPAQQVAPGPQPPVIAPATPATPPVALPVPQAAPAAPAPATTMPTPPSSPPPALAPPAASAPAPAGPVAPVEPGKSVDSAGKMVEVAARPALRIKGKSTWDDGFDTLKKSLAALDAEVKKLGLVPEGQPMAHFVDSDDNGFTYEALVLIKDPLATGVALSAGLDATLSPAGKAVEFQHEGAYDDIDSAYEAFTAWLDDKGLVSTGRFLEEYTFWPEKSDDPAMKLKITVFLK